MASEHVVVREPLHSSQTSSYVMCRLSPVLNWIQYFPLHPLLSLALMMPSDNIRQVKEPP